jgi:hypothetical protein
MPTTVHIQAIALHMPCAQPKPGDAAPLGLSIMARNSSNREIMSRSGRWIENAARTPVPRAFDATGDAAPKRGTETREENGQQ